MGSSFFAYNPANLKGLRQNIFYLIKWGFSLEEIKNISINEYSDYLEFLIEHYKEKNKASKNSSSKSSAKSYKTVGNTAPKK